MVYGHMTLARWLSEGHEGKRVLCNGVDITQECVEFNDREQWAVVHRLMRDRAGRAEIERETLRGKIEVQDGQRTGSDT